MNKSLQKDSEILMRKNCTLTNDGMLFFKDQNYVPYVVDLRNLIMDEFHKRCYLGHPRY